MSPAFHLPILFSVIFSLTEKINYVSVERVAH